MTPAATSLSNRWVRRCATDGEFCMAARYWSCQLEIDLAGDIIALTVVDGRVVEQAPGESEGLGHVRISAPAETWNRVLAPVPPPFYQDILPARAMGLRLEIDEETLWQYYPAIRRAIDLLREENNASAATL